MPKTVLIAIGLVVAAAVVTVAALNAGGGSSGGARKGGDVGAPPAGIPNAYAGASSLADASLTSDTLGQLAPALPAAEGYGVGGGGDEAPAGGGPGGGGLSLPSTLDRKIVRSATLELEVEDVAAAVQQVEDAARSAGGFVSASSMFTQGDSAPSQEGDAEPPQRTRTATVTIRVPAEAYPGVMSRLRGVAKEVRSESSEASEVTEEYTDLQARLRNLEATEARYLELLAKADKIGDILTVQDRVNAVRLEIEQVQGRINVMDDLSDLATISVQLRTYVPGEEEPSEPGWAQEAWDNAWETSKDALKALGTVAITAGVVLAWLAVPSLAIVIGWRLLGPRRERKGEA